ncbi:MAG TPA: response regulator [Puia sp.]|jgi:CheY-like chemotaxis protein|nr:response regulator [Puia sp.]
MKKPYRILLCDDDPDEALFLETSFVKAGYQVDLECFDRCSKLLDHLPVRPEVPDLIFVDINMPGEDGLECVGMIRQLSTYRDVPTIMYTTSLREKDIDAAFKNGASLYIPKTSSEAELAEIVHYLLTRDWAGLEGAKKDGFCYFPKKKAR